VSGVTTEATSSLSLMYPQRGFAAAARRIRALLLRHAYLLLKSWPRLVSMAYYPTVTMVLWAFLTLYLAPTNSFLKDAPGFFIGAVLLWDVLFRGQLGVSLTFLEEMHSRNLANLFVSPLRLGEFISGQLAMSVLRTLIGVGGACVFAALLFHYSIFSFGVPLIAFFTLLIVFGWAIGLAVSALILRWGLGAEELAWAAIFLIAPVSGVSIRSRSCPDGCRRWATRFPRRTCSKECARCCSPATSRGGTSGRPSG
jgi:ABC-2 type transport system permease protein